MNPEKTEQAVPTQRTESNPAISVIIPVYNAADVIDSSVDSVLKNTFQDFELLLIDDGSTDASAERCRALQEKDERIRVIHLPKNRGVSAARNRGLDEARGEYIGFVDADDKVTEDYLGRLYERAEAKRLDWVACGSMRRYKDGRTTIDEAVCEERDFCDDETKEAVAELVFPVTETQNLAAVVQALYRRTFLAEHALRFRETAAYGEDTLFNYQASKHIRRFGYIREPLYIIHRSNASGTVRSYASFFHRRVISLLGELNQTRKEEGDDWSEGMLRYISSRIGLVFAQECVLLSGREKRAVYHELDEFLWREIPDAWGGIIEKTTGDKMNRLYLFLLTKKWYEAAFRMVTLSGLRKKLFKAGNIHQKKPVSAGKKE